MEEDLEKIQWEVDEHIVVVKVCNENRWLEWEDWKWKERGGGAENEGGGQKREEADKDAYEKKNLWRLARCSFK